MEQKIINFINQFNIKNNSNINYKIENDNILTLSQSGIVSTKDNLKELKLQLLHNFPKIIFFKEKKGYCQENPSIKLISDIQFLLQPFDNVIRQMQDIQSQMIQNQSRTIKTDNLISCIYYSNIKNTGKNILLLGEQHIETDITPLTNFFTELMEKKGENCLDFFMEDSLLSEIQDQQKNNSLIKIKDFCNNLRHYNGVRIHEIDNRCVLFGYGFIICVFKILYLLKPEYIDNTYDKTEKYNILLFVLRLKNKSGYKQGEKLCFTLLKNYNVILKNINPKYQEIYNKHFHILSSFLNENEIDNIDTFYEKIENNDHPFFKSIKDNKYYDDKLKKQIENIDTQYFTVDELLEYYYSYKIINFKVVLLDILVIVRMFQKFNYTKHRVPVCNNDSKSLKNIIFYGGHIHSINIKHFIENVIFKNNVTEIDTSKKIDTNFIPIHFNYFHFIEHINNEYKKRYTEEERRNIINQYILSVWNFNYEWRFLKNPLFNTKNKLLLKIEKVLNRFLCKDFNESIEYNKLGIKKKNICYFILFGNYYIIDNNKISIFSPKEIIQLKRNIIDFIGEYIDPVHYNDITYYTQQNNRLTISQKGIVSIEDNIKKLKEVLLQHFSQYIEVIEEKEGYCKENTKIKILSSVIFQINLPIIPFL